MISSPLRRTADSLLRNVFSTSHEGNGKGAMRQARHLKVLEPSLEWWKVGALTSLTCHSDERGGSGVVAAPCIVSRHVIPAWGHIQPPTSWRGCLMFLHFLLSSSTVLD